MENWCFILIAIVIMETVLTLIFFKMEKDFKVKSTEIQKKIEEIKTKKLVLQNKNNMECFDSKSINQITKQFLKIHYLIVKKHLK